MDARSPRLVIGFACAAHAYVHILMALYVTIVLALEDAWGLSYDALIRLWIAGALLVGAGAPLAGWLSD